MRNKLFVLVCSTSILLFTACNNAEKNKTVPASAESSSVKKVINTQMTPGQIHNQILEAYIQQYGIAPDNQITVAEVETMCDRIAQICADQGFLENISVADFGDELYDIYVSSGAFENGVLRPTDELITMTNNEVINIDIKSAYTQIHNMAVQSDPDFMSKSIQLLDGLTGLNIEEQMEVNGTKAVLEASYTLWNTPYLPANGNGIDMSIYNADMSGYSKGYNVGLASGEGREYSEFLGAAYSASRSNAARIMP